jgi:hypothetical protein
MPAALLVQVGLIPSQYIFNGCIQMMRSETVPIKRSSS